MKISFFFVIVTIVATLLAFSVGVFKPYGFVLVPDPTGYVPSIRHESNSTPIANYKLCTFELLKDCVVTGTFFPDEVTWIWENKTLSYFEPSQCDFKYQSDIPTSYMNQCFSRLHQQNISKLLLIGDSTAMRLFLAMWNRLETAGFQCKAVENEDSNPWVSDLKYDAGQRWKPKILRTLRDVPINSRGGFWTKSAFLDCLTDSSMRLQVEYVMMWHYSYIEVKTLTPSTHRKCINKTCPSSRTKFQFALIEYLEHRRPDFIFLMGHHHYRNQQMHASKTDINTLADLLHNTVPRTTPIVWLTTASEDVDKKPEKWKNRMYYGYDSQGYIRVLNQAVFDTLKPIINKKYSNFLPFFDLQSASNGVAFEMNLDGEHMSATWYQLIASYLLQTICESALNELLGDLTQS